MSSGLFSLIFCCGEVTTFGPHRSHLENESVGPQDLFSALNYADLYDLRLAEDNGAFGMLCL